MTSNPAPRVLYAVCIVTGGHPIGPERHQKVLSYHYTEEDAEDAKDTEAASRSDYSTWERIREFECVIRDGIATRVAWTAPLIEPSSD